MSSKLISLLREQPLDTKNTSVASWVVARGSSGVYVFAEHHTICHGVLGSSYDTVGAKTALKKNNKLSAVAELAYFDWLFNRSSYAPLFVDKEAEEAIEAKFTIIYHKSCRMGIKGAAMMSRMPYEMPHRINMWHSLVVGGYNEAVAYLVVMSMPTNITDVHDNSAHLTNSPRELREGRINTFVRGPLLLNNENKTHKDLLGADSVGDYGVVNWPRKRAVLTGTGLFGKTEGNGSVSGPLTLDDYRQFALENKEQIYQQLFVEDLL